MSNVIHAVRDGEKRDFSVEAWKQFPEHKYGWKQATEEPDEVKNLKNAGSDGTAAGSGTGGKTENPQAGQNVNNADTATDLGSGNPGGAADAGTGNEQAPKMNAAELAQKIHEAETLEAVAALVPEGEARKTVLQAAEARKKQLAGE